MTPVKEKKETRPCIMDTPSKPEEIKIGSKVVLEILEEGEKPLAGFRISR